MVCYCRAWNRRVGHGMVMFALNLYRNHTVKEILTSNQLPKTLLKYKNHL